MSRSRVAHRALLACLALTLLVVLPTQAQDPWWEKYLPPPTVPPPFPPSPPPPQCCVPEAITPPTILPCNEPCDGQADCSGDVSPGAYYMAHCIEPPTGGGWCARSAHSVYVPDYICMAMECTINGEPGEECRWIILFGSGYSGFGLECHPSAVMCN